MVFIYAGQKGIFAALQYEVILSILCFSGKGDDCHDQTGDLLYRGYICRCNVFCAEAAFN